MSLWTFEEKDCGVCFILELEELQIICILTLTKAYCLRAVDIVLSKSFSPHISVWKCRMKTWMMIYIVRYHLALES